MDMAMKMYDAQRAGIEEGMQKGVRKGKIDLIQGLVTKFRQQGMDDTEIRAQLHSMFDDQVGKETIDQIVNQK